MAVKSTSIIGKLDAKRAKLNVEAETARVRAKNLEVQITELQMTATTNVAKADAINKALKILDEAGVTV